jgi:hypothetical protein
MMEVTVDEANRILIIDARGMVSEADIDACANDLSARYPYFDVRPVGGRGPIGVLLDWRELEGWVKGAKTLSTLTAKMLSDVVTRAAIVADDKWRDEVPRLADANKRAKLRMFAPDQRDAALAWLRGD